MTIDPTVQRALDNLRTVNWDHLGAGELADAEELVVSAVRTAHLQELAGETEEEALEKAVHEAQADLDTVLADSTVRRVITAIAPILLAPLRAKLQAQEARIKELEQERLCDCGKPLTRGVCSGHCDNDE